VLGMMAMSTKAQKAMGLGISLPLSKRVRSRCEVMESRDMFIVFFGQGVDVECSET
jgi:hypothetical protein